MNPAVLEITERQKNVRCDFCNRDEIQPLLFGPMYKRDGITMHYFCMLFSAGLSQRGDDDEGFLGFLTEDVRKELNRGKKLKCKYCRGPKATVGCSVKSCKVSFHYTCGFENNSLFQFIGNYESYCSAHRPKIEISLERILWECPICYEDVDERDDPMFPPCCKKAVFHRVCMMKMASNHGIPFFKCPLCNDVKKFSKSMRMGGVYVPDRDAAWELEPNAFAELNQHYKKCDAEPCLCPRGREYDSKDKVDTAWKIVRCGGCGAEAVHKECGKLPYLTYRCNMCSRVLAGTAALDDSDSDEDNPRRNRRGVAHQRELRRITRRQYDSSGDSDDDETDVPNITNVLSQNPVIDKIPEDNPLPPASSWRNLVGIAKTSASIYSLPYKVRAGALVEDEDSSDDEESEDDDDYEEFQIIKPDSGNMLKTSNSDAASKNDNDNHSNEVRTGLVEVSGSTGGEELNFLVSNVDSIGSGSSSRRLRSNVAYPTTNPMLVDERGPEIKIDNKSLKNIEKITDLFKKKLNNSDSDAGTSSKLLQNGIQPNKPQHNQKQVEPVNPVEIDKVVSKLMEKFPNLQSAKSSRESQSVQHGKENPTPSLPKSSATSSANANKDKTKQNLNQINPKDKDKKVLTKQKIQSKELLNGVGTHSAESESKKSKDVSDMLDNHRRSMLRSKAKANETTPKKVEPPSRSQVSTPKTFQSSSSKKSRDSSNSSKNKNTDSELKVVYEKSSPFPTPSPNLRQSKLDKWVSPTKELSHASEVHARKTRIFINCDDGLDSRNSDIEKPAPLSSILTSILEQTSTPSHSKTQVPSLPEKVATKLLISSIHDTTESIVECSPNHSGTSDGQSSVTAKECNRHVEINVTDDCDSDIECVFVESVKAQNKTDEVQLIELDDRRENSSQNVSFPSTADTSKSCGDEDDDEIQVEVIKLVKPKTEPQLPATDSTEFPVSTALRRFSEPKDQDVKLFPSTITKYFSGRNTHGLSAALMENSAFMSQSVGKQKRSKLRENRTGPDSSNVEIVILDSDEEDGNNSNSCPEAGSSSDNTSLVSDKADTANEISSGENVDETPKPNRDENGNTSSKRTRKAASEELEGSSVNKRPRVAEK